MFLQVFCFAFSYRSGFTPCFQTAAPPLCAQVIGITFCLCTSFLFTGFVPVEQFNFCFLARIGEGDSPSKLLVPKRTGDKFVPRPRTLSC